MAELAVMLDDDEVLIPRSIRRHEFYEGARESFVCLMESEGVAGPREPIAVGLPTEFGPDAKLVNTRDATPVRQPVQQLSPALLGTLKERLAGLQEAGFIRPSTSAWSSPIVMVKHPTRKIGIRCQ